MLASMSGEGNCSDNAVAESFFSTLEVELRKKRLAYQGRPLLRVHPDVPPCGVNAATGQVD